MSSPGRRSPSPRRRSPSPKRSPRSPSPRRRSPSPRRRSPSPRGRSPRGRSPPPRRGDSPRRRDERGPYYRPPPRVQGNERDRRNSTTLFVGNLPYHFRERDVAEYFERAGRVRTIKIGLNYRTGESKGYCFVEFESRRDAEDAYDRFQGYNLDGRRLRIDWDVGLDKKRKRSPRRSRSRSPRGRRSPVNRSPSPKRLSPKRSPSPPPRRDN